MSDILSYINRELSKKLAKDEEEMLMGMASTSANPDQETSLSYDDFIEAIKKIKRPDRHFWQKLFDEFGLNKEEKSLYLPMWFKSECPPVPDGFEVYFTELLKDNQLLVGPNTLNPKIDILGTDDFIYDNFKP